jgi:hypothetical protein
LAIWEGFFDSPARSGDPNQFGQRDGAGGVDDVVGHLGGFADRAADQQLVVLGAGRDDQPVVESLAFAAGPGREALPAAFRRERGELVSACGTAGSGTSLSQEMAIT